MEREWLFLLIPLVIGVSFLGVGVYGLRRADSLRRTGITAVGHIVRHDTRHGDEGARYHHPVVAWTTREGRACTYPAMFGRGKVTRGFGVGARVMVLYDERNPARFELSGWDSKAFFVVFTGVGAALTVGASSAFLILLMTH
ncbi:DUF3592 domain-containing protein [Streptomyces sp. ASQP_92]|uniref:DUF3592 domain-containing protein n=1 Tax=Streptomyces sp. ASQP_92 TaxID=2979116 RepID=UPI0021C032E7|nr:DUF3592 domain-containing protein [Streptomyces sp. ASQP_92]MCT9089940.1 DUF3592 domain-containing protein [Streptomyces sp. ASQP_92]